MPTREAAQQERGEAPRGRGSRDAATRQRLLDAGLQLFAEAGFNGVTVRDLCRAAGANVAAVNYHFGDKLGLYREVMERALEGARDDVTISAPKDAGPVDRLQHYVRTLLPRLAIPSSEVVLAQKLMRHEMDDPTPLAAWVAEEVILPRIGFLSDAVAELLGTDVDDPRVRRCVLSLHAQCLFYMPNNFRKVAMPGWREMTEAEIAATADHIVAFSLAGIERIAGA